MEDIITIIWVVIALLGAVINAIYKRTPKDTEDEEAQEPTAELPQRPVVIRVPAPAPATEARSIESESLESLESLETDWQRKPLKRPTKQFKPKHTPKNHTTQPLTRLQPKTKVEPQPEETHELMRDFDLERAVVYSEILKPKYQEYE